MLRRFPGLDTLVNNAGIQRYIDLKKGFDELRSGGDEIAVNFVSLVELCALFIPHLMGKKQGTTAGLRSAGVSRKPLQMLRCN